jgi:2-polyprenyl-6-methoxyphenol hydroxylase-like FAD-dependent oxidoreductase
MTAETPPQAADVVIIGGGPTGLMLACELRLAGVDPVVLERLPEISQIPKGNGLVGQIVPTLDYRGLLDRFRAESTYVGPLPQFGFGPLQLQFGRLGTSPLHGLAIPQRRMEHLLNERLTELGGTVRRGHELAAMDLSGDDHVTLDVRSPDGNYRLRARYLVGCDGAHSQVRKQAGIGFPGVTSPEVSRIGRVFLPAVKITASGEAEVPGIGRVPVMATQQTPNGAYSFGPLATLDKTAPPGVFIFFTREDRAATLADPDAPMELDELRASARRVLGTDLEMRDPQWLTRTVGNNRQADRYRAGPVFLAGDAAHLFGLGGSLNVSLLDALNLGWKLGAAHKDQAMDGLLDTYHSERHAAGQRTLVSSLVQRALSVRDEYGAALRELFGELMQYPDPLRHVGMMMEGSDLRYELPAPPHPLLGRLAPDLALEADSGMREADPAQANSAPEAGGRTRVAELVRPARGVLLDLTGSGEVAGAASAWSDRVDVVTARPVARPAPADAMLIRPDGYVAWAAGPDGTDLTGGLSEALHTWFGTPR